MSSNYKELAAYKRFIQHAQTRWESFLTQRSEKLSQQTRFEKAPEKVSENIVGTLLTTVLGWEEGDLNWQLDRADLVVTRNFVKYLVIETKHPGSLRTQRTIDAALQQARRYADEQRVNRIAICDGFLFYGADIESGGIRHRTAFDLTQPQAPHDSLWWVSIDGVYRACESEPDISILTRLQEKDDHERQSVNDSTEIIHPKYQLPAQCFAYVGDSRKISTWKLPYLQFDGRPDLKRLPKAAQALASNYRGAKVAGIPESAIPDVFRRLGLAAKEAGKMPAPGISAAPIYQQLSEIIEQLNAAGK